MQFKLIKMLQEPTQYSIKQAIQTWNAAGKTEQELKENAVTIVQFICSLYEDGKNHAEITHRLILEGLDKEMADQFILLGFESSIHLDKKGVIPNGYELNKLGLPNHLKKYKYKMWASLAILFSAIIYGLVKLNVAMSFYI